MSSPLQEVDVTTVKTWLQQGTARLYDIREADEFRREHISGAAFMPQARPTSVDADAVADADADTGEAGNKDVKAVFYCNSGQRTREAATRITNAGYRESFALEGGLSAWKSAGFATELNRKAPISLQRQVQITAGSLVVSGLLLALLISPWFALLSGFVGAGLIFAGVSNTCALARILALLPYNRVKNETRADPSADQKAAA